MTESTENPRTFTAIHFAILSLCVGVALLGVKLVAWRLTGSVALLSDALEGTVNVVAAGIATVSLWIASKPADQDHPFGHGKAEYFSAGAEAMLIVVAAVVIVVEAVGHLQNPLPITQVEIGLAISVVAAVGNGVLAWILVRAGRQHSSPALTADGWHLWTDVITSVGVVLGVLLASLTSWWLLDPLVAIVVALNIIRIGWHTAKMAVDGLMDKALGDDEVEALSRLIRDNAKGALQFHDLRTRSGGRTVFVEFHLVVPASMTVQESHDICDAIEAALKADHNNMHVTIHVEPTENFEDAGERVGG